MAVLVSRAALVATARSYAGTPWVHQGRLPGIALDCVGMLICIAHAHGLSDYDIDGYHTTPDPDVLLGELDAQMDRINPADALIGDVYVMAWTTKGKQVPRHLGIKARHDPDYVIHVYNGGPRRVVEHIIDAEWRARIVRAYRYRAEFAP